MRSALPLVLLAALTMAAPALGQQAAPENLPRPATVPPLDAGEQTPATSAAPATPDGTTVTDQTKPALATDPSVVESQLPTPTPQGTRAPDAETGQATAAPSLQDALAALRQAPPDLQGNPVQRPNQLAAEPNQPDPQQTR